MPHLPDHITHDPELIAAYAAGDATGPDLALATELVADCTACAALHRDLRAIATALPELPVPARSRDFRLTPEQAASLAPSGWRGLLAAFASPRFRLAAPLGTGLAAIGLAGLLLGTPGSVLPVGGGTGSANSAAAGAAPAAQSAPAAASGPSLEFAPAPSPYLGVVLTDGGGKAPDPAGLTGPAESAAASTAPAMAVDPVASDDAVAAGPASLPAPTSAADREMALQAATPLPGGSVPLVELRAPDADAGATGTSPWLFVSAALLLVGVALIVLRLASRSIGRS